MMAGNIWRDFEWVVEVRPKRKSIEVEWANNERKRMKVAGKEYVNTKGVRVKLVTRQTGTKCRQVTNLNVYFTLSDPGLG